MVRSAAAEPKPNHKRKKYPILAREDRFACLIAAGSTQAEAYRLVYGASRWPDKRGAEIANRPQVRARVEELRRKAAEGVVLDMRRRRETLARIAEHTGGWGEAPGYGERIAAIREDAILAGERRTDGTQINIGVQVTAPVILAALRGLSVAGPTETQTDALGVPTAAVDAEVAPVPETRAGTLVGPLGVIVAGSEASAGLLADV